MSRPAVLALAESPSIRSLLLKRGTKGGLVSRFVAGEQLHEALQVTKDLKEKGINAALDFLGENFTRPEDIAVAIEQYKEAIKAISTFYPDAYVSIKLTALGLASDPQLARQNLQILIDEAIARGDVYLRIDMEGSQYTRETFKIVHEAFAIYPHIGAVVQAYLRTSDRDLEDLIDSGISVRLVKGAYAERPAIAYSKKDDVDTAYRRLMFRLLDSGGYHAIATHDEGMVKAVQLYIRQKNIPKDRFEFEMLMGVRSKLQEQLATEKYNVRTYVPYGDSWYPYFTRRLAERPENVMFLLANLFK